MGLLPDNVQLRDAHAPECGERFPRHQLQRKPLVSDLGVHNGSCVMHVGSLTRDGRENDPGIPDAYAVRNFTHLARDPCYSDQQICPPTTSTRLYQLNSTINSVWPCHTLTYRSGFARQNAQNDNQNSCESYAIQFAALSPRGQWLHINQFLLYVYIHTDFSSVLYQYPVMRGYWSLA